MLKLIVLLHTILVRADTGLRVQLNSPRNERGSVTTEHVLWAVAVIAIVGIVVAAVKSYVTSQAGNLK